MEKIKVLLILFVILIPPRIRITTNIPKTAICTVETVEVHHDTRGRNYS